MVSAESLKKAVSSSKIDEIRGNIVQKVPDVRKNVRYK